MKNKIFFPTIIFILLGTTLFVSSCNEEEFLNRYPKDIPNPENFFIDESSARKAVNAAYEPWANSSRMYTRDLVIMCDAMTDDSYWRPSRTSSIQQEMWDIYPSHGDIEYYWEYPFRSINAANFAIERIPTSTGAAFTPDKQKPFIADARFMRGFAYLFLVTLFGDVPLMDHPLSSMEEFNQPRAPIEDVYTQIISDFEYAKENLPAKWASAYTGAATRAAAAAYLAKTYLYKKDFPKAETAAREAIQIAESDGYYLIDDYLSIWEEDNEGNPELLFYIEFMHDNDEHGQNMTIQRIVRGCPAEFKNIYGAGDGWGYALPQRDLYDAFEPNDPRREYTIQSPLKPFGIYKGPPETFTYKHEFYNAAGVKQTYTKTYHPDDTVDFDYRWSETGMSVRKMITDMQGITNVRWCGQDVPVMRMADLYLYLAEALAEQGDAEALVWVNKVRARKTVNMPPKTAGDGNLVDIVRHERRVELALEGERLFDLIRWGNLGEVFGNGQKVKRHFYSDYLPVNDLKSRFDTPVKDLSQNYLFPIPQSEIDQNSEINSNNPGYN